MRIGLTLGDKLIGGQVWMIHYNYNFQNKWMKIKLLEYCLDGYLSPTLTSTHILQQLFELPIPSLTKLWKYQLPFKTFCFLLFTFKNIPLFSLFQSLADHFPSTSLLLAYFTESYFGNWGQHYTLESTVLPQESD